VSPQVTVFWRPGCPYCWRLRSKLRRAGVQVDEVNIWRTRPVQPSFGRSLVATKRCLPCASGRSHS
jgi:mycoredoxin